jgi:hypothetical protein
MSNTLTGLIPTIYESLDVVSRELVGFIPAVTRDASVERAALNQNVRARVCPALVSADIVPSGTLPDPSGISYGYTDMAITKSKCVRVPWDLEEIKSVDDQAAYNKDAFAQAFRTLANEIEIDLAGLYVNASRAYGTAGVTPLGTAGDLSDIAYVRQILEDNGAPQSDLQLVLSSGAIANMRAKQGIVFKVNESGDANRQATGDIIKLEGMNIRNSGQVKLHTKGTGTGYLVNLIAGYPAGSTSILLDTGANTMIAGDVVKNTTLGVAEPNRYVVKTALTAGTVVLQNPGLRLPWVNDDAIDILANYRANLAFARTAILLAARIPQRPEKDAALDVTIVTDPVSGLSFEVAVYGGYRKIWYEIAACWGVKASKPEHIAILLG